MKDTVQLKPARFYWFTPWGLAIGAAILAWRYFITGRELRGEGDNATFLHDATTDHRGRPYEKLTRARWRRVARRWALVGVPAWLAFMSAVAHVGRMADLAWAYWPWGWLFIGWLLGVALVGLGWAGTKLARWWPVRQIRRELVRPAAQVLCRTVGVKVSRRRMDALIVLPPGFGDRPDAGTARVYMPSAAVALDERAKDRIVALVGAKLGLPNAQGAWTIATARAYVDLTGAPLPPDALDFADVRAAMLAAEPDRPVLGVAQGGRVVTADYVNDSPHVLISAAAGAGKSTLLKVLAMQRMRHGAGAIFIDFKRWSHLRWVRGLPATSALYFHEIPAIHEALVAIMEEVIRRKSIDDEDELDALRRLDVYVEEMNTLVGMLRDYWRVTVAQAKAAARASGDPDELAEAMGMPLISPAIQALQYSVNLGREFKVHQHFIGQSMSANASAGRDTRESFRTRLLARWDRKTWRIFADGVPFQVCPSGPVGLWAHVAGGTVDMIRVPRVSDVQAREFVLSGVRDIRTPILSRDIGGDVSHVLVSRRVLPPLSTLSEIVSGNVLPAGRGGRVASLKALQLAAGREGFPAPAQRGGPGEAHLYRTEEIVAWWQEREGPDAIAA
jgi:hypothetical protein